VKKSAKEILNKKEVSLSELLNYFWERKKVFLLSIVVMVFLGSIKYFATPSSYESVATKIVEMENANPNSFGQLGSLSAFSGLNFGASSSISGISHEMYPEIIASKPFLVELVNEKFYFESKGDSLLLKDYLIEDYSSKPLNIILGGIASIPSRVASIFVDNNPVVSPVVQSALLDQGSPKYLILTNEEDLASELLKNRIKIEEEGTMITLSVQMPEPYVAAELNHIIFDKIVKYVTDYKTKKMRISLGFVEERAIEAEENFIRSQLALASFRDTNQGIISQRARSREEQLQAEFNIAFNLYNTMTQELENSKIQLKKETPVFSNFAAPLVPNNPVNGTFFRTFILFGFLGILVGFGMVIFGMVREFFSSNPVPID
jgi:uncharacterized protein involved in exopolysaccharide biosynthesis